MDFHQPGIYFDMPEKEYHADKSLSASGIKNLMASPLCYWINSPLNPRRKEETTESQEIGKAFHKRVLEGKDSFDESYAKKISPDDYPGALKSLDQLKERCDQLSIPRSGTILELSRRIRMHDTNALLWSEIEESHISRNQGKIFLSDEAMRQIDLAAQNVEKNVELRKLFDNGHSEVSIFWEDEMTGVKMKRRLDYFKPGLIVEMKTFSNMKGRSPAKEACRHMAEYHYGIDAHCSFDAAHEARKLHTGFNTEAKLYFLFFQKGPVPHVVLKEFGQKKRGATNNYFELTNIQYRSGISLYKECVDKWGMDKPWYDEVQIEEFDDEDFPSWAFND